MDIAHERLHNQQLTRHKFSNPADVVGWLGAVQSQDYAGAKWALGQRVPGASDADLDHAFNSGAILRTHVLRPTWHFVLPADIHWMLALTAPRVNALNAYMYRQLGLDDALFVKSNALIAKALEGGKHLTRPELMSILQRAGLNIDTSNPLRGSYIMMRSELDGIVCSGSRRGKQFTYALIDERAPQTKTLGREEALAELVRRYIMSHGPATLQDFAWWSGLTLADARAGLELSKPQFMHEYLDGQTYWFSELAPTKTSAKNASHIAYLLPNYDEYISYKDRSAMFDAANAAKMDPESNTVFAHMIIINGLMVGTWKRTLTKHKVVIETSLFTSLDEFDAHALVVAAEQYGRFLGLEVRLRT